MSVHDLDRQDRLERLQDFREEVDKTAQLDVESLIENNVISSLMTTGALNLGIYESAAKKYDNSELLLLVRGVARYRATVEEDFEVKRRLRRIAIAK